MVIVGSLGTRIKGYTSSSRNGKHTLKVEIEYDDASAIGYEMSKIDEHMAEAKEAAKPPPRKPRGRAKKIENKKPLALPAPDEIA